MSALRSKADIKLNLLKRSANDPKRTSSEWLFQGLRHRCQFAVGLPLLQPSELLGHVGSDLCHYVMKLWFVAYGLQIRIVFEVIPPPEAPARVDGLA